MKPIMQRIQPVISSLRQYPWVEKIKGNLKMLITIIVAILLIILLTIFYPKQHKIIVQPANKTLQRLSNVEAELRALNSVMQQPQQTNSVGLSRVSHQLVTINNNVDEIANKLTNENMTHALTVSQSKILDNFQQVTQLLHTIKQRVTPTEYLPESALPFRVVGVDIWNGRPKATIRVANDLAPPMGVNDMQDGWTLIHLQFSPAEVIFRNAHGQKVKVTL